MDRREIIERLEKLQGSDREVDIAICLALHYVGGHHVGTIENLRRSAPDDDYLDYECHDDGGSIPECTDKAPALTASLDAAVALVEKCLPGWSNSTISVPAGCEAYIWNEGKPDAFGEHKVRAIALLIALFHALPEDGKP